MTQQSWQGRDREFAERIAVLTRMAERLQAIDVATTGVSDMLLTLARQGDESLVALDEDGDLFGCTDDGEDLLGELTAIDRGRRNAMRILQVLAPVLLEDQGA